jgi:hypothetical protein
LRDLLKLFDRGKRLGRGKNGMGGTMVHGVALGTKGLSLRRFSIAAP